MMLTFAYRAVCGCFFFLLFCAAAKKNNTRNENDVKADFCKSHIHGGTNVTNIKSQLDYGKIVWAIWNRCEPITHAPTRRERVGCHRRIRRMLFENWSRWIVVATKPSMNFMHLAAAAWGNYVQWNSQSTIFICNRTVSFSHFTIQFSVWFAWCSSKRLIICGS